MPRVKQKQPTKSAKPGRNDPCWCGSGRKYKDCHLPQDDARRAEQRKLKQAEDTLMPKIIEAAENITTALPGALALFWNDKYTPAQVAELDDLEDRGSERFMTWFAFDHILEPETADAQPRTLVETLVTAAADGTFETDEYEQRLLQNWASVRLRPYVVEAINKGQGFTARDLFDNAVLEVKEKAASRRLEPGEVVVGHLIPVQMPSVEVVTPEDNTAAPDYAPDELIYYVAGASAQLTSDTCDQLLEFATLHLQDLQRSQPDATLDDLLRQRSHVLNHFVMELPEEATPGIIEDFLLRTRVGLQLAGVSLPGGPKADSDTDTTDTDETEATDTTTNTPALKEPPDAP